MSDDVTDDRSRADRLDTARGESLPERWLPAISWAREMGPADVFRDISVGLLLASVLLPQAMAYALLAELPAEMGILACLAPALAYALFGSSRFLAVGPVALVSLLAGEAIARTAAESGVPASQLALLLSVLCGVFLLAGGLAGLGRASDFLGKPVLDGFAAGAAVLIASTQVRHLLGLRIERSPDLPARVGRWVEHFDTFDATTLCVGLGALFLLTMVAWLLDRLLRRAGLPDLVCDQLRRSFPILVLLAAGLVTWSLDLEHSHPGHVGKLETVGRVSPALPELALPPLERELAIELCTSALVIAIITFVTGVAIGRALAGADEQVRPGREMRALGLANVASGLTGGFPVGASVSRSSVAADAGARSPLAAAVASVAVFAAAFGFGEVFLYLPKAALAALIITASAGLVNPRGLLRTIRFSRRDGAVLVLTFLGVLVLGVDRGFLLGVLISFALQLWHMARPRVTVLGFDTEDGDGELLRSSEREGVEERVTDPVLVLRLEEGLYFANARHVHETIVETILGIEGVRCLLLDLRSVEAVDSSALAMLEELQETLDDAGILLAMAHPQSDVEERLRAIGFFDRLGPENVYRRVEEGKEDLESRCA